MPFLAAIAKSQRFLYHFHMSAGTRKAALIGLCVLLLLGGSALGQKLKVGEQAFFLKNGDTLIGEIVEIDAEKSALLIKDGTSILLRDLWMVNFADEQWNFPSERDLIETNEHYIFLGMSRPAE